jgi:hypothetical protein
MGWKFATSWWHVIQTTDFVIMLKHLNPIAGVKFIGCFGGLIYINKLN